MASAVPTQHDLIAESAAAVAAHKELLTTPCMVYDAINRRISPNPSYSRPRMMHMARVQSSFIGLIRNAHRLREERTPKELLFAVEQALIYAMASTAATTATHEVRTPMTYTSITNDAELQPHLVLLEHVLAHHDVASSSITAMGHLLANDVCYEALTTVLDHLLVRLTQEKLEDGRRSAEERKALAATLQNARDCKRCVEEMHTAYHTIDTPSQHQRRTPLTMIAPLPQQRAAMLHASTTASKLLMASYYGLLGCVTTLDPDRRALQGANVDARTSSSTSSSSISSSAMVEEYDPYSGKLVLARPLSSCRWGLSFNEAGFVVGVSNTLRTSTEAGERLFHALQLRATTGLRVREVQRRRIGGAKSSTSPLAEIINKMQSMADSDSLTLLLEKVPQPDLTSAHEVLFTMADQGNERSSGQHAVLVLQRFSTAVPWGCRFAMDAPSQQLHLVDCASSVRLCPAAKEFLFDFRNRLRVVQLNYRDVRQIDGMARVEDVVGSTVLLALGLQVLPATTTDEATMAVPPPPPPPTTTTATLDDVSSSSPAGLDDTDADVVRSEMFASAETTAAVDADPTLTAIDAASGELGDEVAHNHDEDARVAEDDVEDGVDAAQQAGAERDEMLPGSESAYGELDDLLKELDEAEELIQQHAQTDNVDASAAMKNIVHVEAEAEEEVDAAEPEVVPSPTADAIDAAVAAVAASTNAADGTYASPSLDAIDAAVAAAAASSCTTDATATQPLVQQPSTDMIDSIVQEILTKKKTMEEHKPRKKAGRPPKKAAATLAVEMDASTNNAAEDVPVLPPRASATELAMDEISTKKKDTSNNIADADDAVKNTKDGEEAAATADAVPRVSLAQLMEASPLHFTNSISANTFDGTTLEMSRPGVEHPWEMLIAFAGPDILLTRLPPLSTAGRTHPFTRYLNPDADGRGRWLIESINGEDLTLLNKKQKVATLELLKKCVNVRLALRGLPK